jgi:hypothetical protein
MNWRGREGAACYAGGAVADRKRALRAAQLAEN